MADAIVRALPRSLACDRCRRLQGSKTAEGVTHVRASALIQKAVRPLKVTLGRPSTAPALDAAGGRKAGVQATLTIDTDYGALVSDTAKLAGFKTELVTEMARELRKSPSEIQITSLRAGSTVVGVFIEEIDPARAAALEAEIRSGPLSEHVGGYSVKAVEVSIAKAATPADAPKVAEASPKTEIADIPRLSIDAVRSIFNEFDSDKSGSIDATEFEVVMYALGEVLTRKEVEAAMSVLDADKNGTIDFNEFFNWINNPRSIEDRDQNRIDRFVHTILRTKLAARYYRKLAENGVERLKTRLQGKPAAPGDYRVNFDLKIGNPNGAISLDFSQKEGDGSSSAALLITLKDGAQEGDIRKVLQILNDALQIMPFHEAPGYASHSLDVVNHLGGRAIRFLIKSAIGVHVPDIELSSPIRACLGASLHSLLDGTATLKDLFKLRVQMDVVVPNHCKVILQALFMENTRHARHSEYPVIFAIAALLRSQKTFNFAIEFDDIMHALNELMELMSGLGEQEKEKGDLFKKVVNNNLSGLREVLNEAVAAALQMLGMQVGDMPVEIASIARAFLAEYDAIQSTLNGVGGVQLNFGVHGYELAFTGANIFGILPTKAEMDHAMQRHSSHSSIHSSLLVRAFEHARHAVGLTNLGDALIQSTLACATPQPRPVAEVLCFGSRCAESGRGNCPDRWLLTRVRPRG